MDASNLGIRAFESRTSLLKVFGHALPLLCAEAIAAAAVYPCILLMRDIARELQIDQPSPDVIIILAFGSLALLVGFTALLVIHEGLSRHLVLDSSGITLDKKPTLPWESVRFACAHAGCIYITTTEGGRSFPDVLESGADEILREIRLRLPECVGTNTGDSEPWTANPEVQRMIHIQRTRFVPVDRLEAQKRSRVIRLGLVLGSLLILGGLSLAWAQSGFRGPDWVAGITRDLAFGCLLCGTLSILFIRGFRVHDFLLLTPEMLITGSRHPIVVWVPSIIGIDGNNNGLYVSLRDGSRVTLRRSDVEERLRQLTGCLDDSGGPAGYVSQDTAARMLKTNSFSAYVRLDKNKVPSRLKWLRRYYLRAGVERVAKARSTGSGA